MALVFQYGSNCSEIQINSKDRLHGDAKFFAIAQTVDDFQLAFDVWSKNRKCAASDIVPTPGSKVWGVLYEVPDFLIERTTASARKRKSLDAIEGEGTNYARQSIAVKSADGQILTAITYRVIDPKPDLKSSLEYVGYIIDGLREHGVPQILRNCKPSRPWNKRGERLRESWCKSLPSIDLPQWSIRSCWTRTMQTSGTLLRARTLPRRRKNTTPFSNTKRSGRAARPLEIAEDRDQPGQDLGAAPSVSVFQKLPDFSRDAHLKNDFVAATPLILCGLSTSNCTEKTKRKPVCQVCQFRAP
jgi:hypothetical protein